MAIALSCVAPVGSAQSQQSTPAVICVQAESSCTHAYKDDKYFEMVDMPGVSLIVSVREDYGLLQFELRIVNTSLHSLDVIPDQIRVYSLDPIAKELTYYHYNAMSARFVARGYRSPLARPAAPRQHNSKQGLTREACW